MDGEKYRTWPNVSPRYQSPGSAHDQSAPLSQSNNKQNNGFYSRALLFHALLTSLSSFQPKDSLHRSAIAPPSNLSTSLLEPFSDCVAKAATTASNSPIPFLMDIYPKSSVCPTHRHTHTLHTLSSPLRSFHSFLYPNATETACEHVFGDIVGCIRCADHNAS